MSTTRKEPSLDTKNSGRKMRAISEASISDSKKATTIMPTKREGGTLQNRGQPMARAQLVVGNGNDYKFRIQGMELSLYNVRSKRKIDGGCITDFAYLTSSNVWICETTTLIVRLHADGCVWKKRGVKTRTFDDEIFDVAEYFYLQSCKSPDPAEDGVMRFVQLIEDEEDGDDDLEIQWSDDDDGDDDDDDADATSNVTVREVAFEESSPQVGGPSSQDREPLEEEEEEGIEADDVVLYASPMAMNVSTQLCTPAASPASARQQQNISTQLSTPQSATSQDANSCYRFAAATPKALRTDLEFGVTADANLALSGVGSGDLLQFVGLPAPLLPTTAEDQLRKELDALRERFSTLERSHAHLQLLVMSLVAPHHGPSQKQFVMTPGRKILKAAQKENQ